MSNKKRMLELMGLNEEIDVNKELSGSLHANDKQDDEEKYKDKKYPDRPFNQIKTKSAETGKAGGDDLEVVG